MVVLNKFMQFAIAVSAMPEAKEFYANILGLKVIAEFRRDDDNWWVTLAVPEEGGPRIVLTTHHEHLKPGTMTLWFSCPHLTASHEALTSHGVNASEIKDDLYGPGSGTKWFNFKDPDGSLIHLEQA